MASKLGFRQHIILILILDLIVLLFIGMGTTGADDTSIIMSFLSVQDEDGNMRLELNPLENGTLAFTVAAIFISFAAVGITSDSNFAGISGALAKFFVAGGATVKFTTVSIMIADYIMVYNLLLGGSNFILLHIVGLFIFVPLILDALFASIDWVRGVNT